MISCIDRSSCFTLPIPLDLASPLLAIAPGPTQVLASSRSLPWSGLLLEKHLTEPGTRSSASIDRNVITMFLGAYSRFDYCDPRGKSVSCLNRRGSITITPAGLTPDLRLFNTSEFTHCALDVGFTRRIAAEMDHPPHLRPEFGAGIRDESIRHILNLLLEELMNRASSNRLYIDSLAYALAARYLALSSLPAKQDSRRSRLPGRILSRIKEKIEANLEADLTLLSLAEESGYSRAHFLRMFQATTGLTPHQYVLEIRLTRAQDCLRRMDASIIDVAASCGFSSQSHMTNVFRQRLEMTPGEFRRSVKTACLA